MTNEEIDELENNIGFMMVEIENSEDKEQKELEFQDEIIKMVDKIENIKKNIE